MAPSVVFKNVSKKYKMHTKTSEKLLDILLPGGYGEDFYALDNLTFEANWGDVVGIVGVNGSGKSTLSNLMAGVIPPTRGEVQVDGEAALIAIAAGLNLELTGRENIELKCLMLGFNRKQIRELEPSIIEFSELEKFIDQPVKKYSSGMRSRLGFAISVNVNPDVLIIDEALSVGDQTFAEKCITRMESFKDMHKTIFFISHSIKQVRDFCPTAMWLEYGQMKDYGPAERVLTEYEDFLQEFKLMSAEEKRQYREKVAQIRSGALQVT